MFILRACQLWVVLFGYARNCDFFMSLQFLGKLPVMHITFYFNAYSIIKVFSFSSTFVEQFSGLGRFCF